MPHEEDLLLAEPVPEIIHYIVHVLDLLLDGHGFVFPASAVVFSGHALVPAYHDAVIGQISALLGHHPASVTYSGTAVHKEKDL